MPDFMLLLHERPEMFADISPDRMQQVIAKYVAWRSKLTGEDKLAGGHKLRFDSGRVLEPGDGSTGRAAGVTVRDGPYTETKDVIGGYFIIRAADYEEAVALSRDCPHLLFGGRIEVREIEPT
jgi:hypothetical protein